MTLTDQFNLLTIEGQRILLPETHLPDYAVIKNVMANNLGRYKRNGFDFDYDPGELLADLQAGKDVNLKKKFHFFPTPPEAIDFVLQLAVPWTGMEVLEPQAGQGHLVEGILEFCTPPAKVDCVEINPINRAILKQKGFNLVGADFLEWQPSKAYDLVIGNPPFHSWHEHFWKMVEVVRPNGQVACIVPKSITFKQDKKTNAVREYIEAVDGEVYALPSGSFKYSGTGVETCVIYLYKPEGGLPGEQLNLL